MKRKGTRDIPDFSHAHTTVRAPSAQDPAARKSAPAPSTARQPLVKPQATSAKSGRRGQ